MSGQEDRSSNAAYKLQRNEDTLILIVVGRKLRGEKREETYLPVPVASGGTGAAGRESPLPAPSPPFFSSGHSVCGSSPQQAVGTVVSPPSHPSRPLKNWSILTFPPQCLDILKSFTLF